MCLQSAEETKERGQRINSGTKPVNMLFKAQNYKWSHKRRLATNKMFVHQFQCKGRSVSSTFSSCFLKQAIPRERMDRERAAWHIALYLSSMDLKHDSWSQIYTHTLNYWLFRGSFLLQLHEDVLKQFSNPNDCTYYSLFININNQLTHRWQRVCGSILNSNEPSSFSD